MLLSLFALLSLLIHLYKLFYNLASTVATTSPSLSLYHDNKRNHHYRYDYNNIGNQDYGLKYGSIDVVFTWVNGSDPIWNAQKKHWGDIYNIHESENHTLNSLNNPRNIYNNHSDGTYGSNMSYSCCNYECYVQQSHK